MSVESPAKTTPRCPLCQNTEHRFAFSERGFGVVQCPACELFYINPYPVDQDQFDTVSDYNYEDLEIVDTDRHYRSSHLFYNAYFPLIEAQSKGAKNVLDVGCGTGHLLERLGKSQPALHRVGLELNAERAAFARLKANCDIYEVPVERFETDMRFDAIFLMNLLSHVPRIDRLFNALRSLLSDDGVVLLKVGEMTSDVKRTAVHDWDIPDHLHFLGMNTMHKICEQFGFRILFHQRQPLSSELFDADTWRAEGRSKLRNAVKWTLMSVPYALPCMARLYDAIHKQTFFTSFITLGLDPDWQGAASE